MRLRCGKLQVISNYLAHFDLKKLPRGKAMHHILGIKGI